MQKEITKVFKCSDFGTLEVIVIDNKEYFPATACARMLGYEHPQNAVSRHCRYSLKQGVPHPQNPNKMLTVNLIPEGDLYRLIVHSKLPSAEKFERWVFDEVLPEIRKTGTFGEIDIQKVITETVKVTAVEVVKQLTPLLCDLSAKKCNDCTEEPTPTRQRQRRKPPGIIERLDEDLRTIVDNMICNPKCTYRDIVEMLADEGISITQASVGRYAQRYF